MNGEIIYVGDERWEVLSREAVVGYHANKDGTGFEYRYVAIMARPVKREQAAKGPRQ